MSHRMNPLFADLPTTIFEEISALARAHGAGNLGQGFPDDPGPQAVRAHAAQALMEGSNQYPPSMGLAELRAAVAEHYGRLEGLDLTAEEVLVTSGATEALAASLMAMLSPGDEALLIQPMYDAYLPLVRQAGATPRFVRLAPPDRRLDEAALEAAVTSRTRLLVLNDPLNPAARVFSHEELAAVARVCMRHDLIAVCARATIPMWSAKSPESMRATQEPVQAPSNLNQPNLSGQRESNPHEQLGKLPGYHYIMPAARDVITRLGGPCHPVAVWAKRPPRRPRGADHGSSPCTA